MKAAVVTAPGSLEIRDLPAPQPGQYQVLCEHLFGSVCAGTDRHLIAGELPLPGIEYPFILGHETVGRVVAVGPGVRNFSEGDLVTRTGYPAADEMGAFWGGFTESGIATDAVAMREDGHPEEEWQPHLINRTLPAGTDPAAATMMITWRETHSYLARLGVGPGTRLAIIGSGGNGFSFLVMARALGADRVVMVGNPHWQSLAARAGASGFVDYRGADVAGALAGESVDGYHVVLDAVGRTGALEQAVGCLASNGKVALYGIDDLGERMAFLNELAESGVETHGPGEYSEAEAHDAVVDLLLGRHLDASIWFDPGKPVPLDSFMDAIAAIDARRSLKALICLSSQSM